MFLRNTGGYRVSQQSFVGGSVGLADGVCIAPKRRDQILQYALELVRRLVFYAFFGVGIFDARAGSCESRRHGNLARRFEPKLASRVFGCLKTRLSLRCLPMNFACR